jgi:hypothetical protein
MECRDVLEAAIARAAGELSPEERRELERHLAGCAPCASESSRIEEAWTRLGEDPDPGVSPEFRRDALEKLRLETLGRRFGRGRAPGGPVWMRLAAALAAGAAGFALARWTARPPAPAASASAAPRGVGLVTVATERRIDAARVVPDLSQNPKLANVAYHREDASGKVGVSFDVTTHYTVVGRPEQKGMADLLAYLVSGAAGTDGARGKAIDLVSRNFGPQQPASPEIVRVLVRTLRTDPNPGVRKKAADALAGLSPTPEIRDAFVAALQSDKNPAVRIVAVESLAKMSITLRDRAAIETLREKATDSGENGFVRVRAAAALKKIDL